MSIKLSSRAEHSQEDPPADAWESEPEGSRVRGIRLQAAEIIAAVLSDSAPGQARARDQLCRLLQANPGRPEVALAAHLIALREEAARSRRPDLTLVRAEAAGVETPTQPSRPGAGRAPALRPGARQTLLHHRPTERVHYGRADRAGLVRLSGDAT
ncbi:hypothetical protein SAMN04487913_11227 [Arthrobacter sp. ok362]|jgi:hypothetical protein|nr:hypothetical protein SAMN04487913_11227 [Arthrobacter sp. ok362]